MLWYFFTFFVKNESFMRLFIFTLIFSVVSINLTAQVEVGIITANGSKNNFSATQLVSIKNSMLVIDVPDAYKPAFRDAFESSWTISDYAFADEAEQDETTRKIRCSFSITPGDNGQNFRTFCEFSMKDHSGQNMQIARFPLQHKPALTESLVGLPEGSNLKEIMYQNGAFHNLHPSFLSLYLKAINNTLSMGKTVWFNEKTLKPTVLPVLASNELFIPEYCFIKPDYFRGTENIMEKESILKKYDYAWQTGEVHNETRFIFLSAQTGNSLYYCVIDSLTGQVIYQDRKQNQYYLKRSDFKNISKAIG
jgi:hypothetical protein